MDQQGGQQWGGPSHTVATLPEGLSGALSPGQGGTRSGDWTKPQGSLMVRVQVYSQGDAVSPTPETLNSGRRNSVGCPPRRASCLLLASENEGGGSGKRGRAEASRTCGGRGVLWPGEAPADHSGCPLPRTQPLKRLSLACVDHHQERERTPRALKENRAPGNVHRR